MLQKQKQQHQHINKGDKMKLDELIEHLDYKDLINFKNVEISGIS